ncbi:flavoprotein [Pectobacterium sp. B1J-3]|uniref:flavoprotein n=1 Tax=Pectobacterium sp. B1J-3 TaxID=3385371 RepID=UPI0039064370
MMNPTLSLLIDKVIVDVMAAKVQDALVIPQHTVLVLITGDDAVGFPTTCRYLNALAQSGYTVHLLFSQSAQALRTIADECLAHARILTETDIAPARLQRYEMLLLPALSSNSLTKIAIGIRDNLASRIAYLALAGNVRVLATLNRECDMTPPLTSLPAAYLAQLRQYISTLENFGIRFIAAQANTRVAANHSRPATVHHTHTTKRLITQRDVRLHDAGQALYITPNVLITPAARDEIANRRITLITQPQEAACIWQK